MKICAYVQRSYDSRGYANDSMDKRQFIGLRVVMDAIQRACGYQIDFAGIDTVHLYDVVLVSITSDCDWWTFIAERVKWKRGNYKVIVGGAGVLHVTPFLPFADYFAIGRGENTMPEIIKVIDGKDADLSVGVIASDTFDENGTYKLADTDKVYPHDIEKADGKTYHEQEIGCNHKCFFCVPSTTSAASYTPWTGGTTSSTEATRRLLW